MNISRANYITIDYETFKELLVKMVEFHDSAKIHLIFNLIA
jgi:hypothetical protein